MVRNAWWNGSYKDQKGQALLIIILVMVIGLAVGLAVASRSLTNLRTATDEQNSQRAFSHAEAGIERLLKSRSGSNASSADYTAFVVPVGGTEFLMNGGNAVKRNQGATIWFVPHRDNGTLNFSNRWGGQFVLYFGDNADCSNSAVEVIVLTGINANNAVSARYAFDPCSTRRSNNNFTAGGAAGTIAGKSLANSSGTITIADGLVARVIPLYKDAVIGVRSISGNAFPSQGKKIESTGTSQNTTRKITVYQGYPELFNEFFQYNLLVPK